MPRSSSKSSGEGLSRAIARLDPDWAQRAADWRRQLSPLVRFDAAAVALLKPAEPRPDMFLMLDGVPRKRLAEWCAGDSANDPLLHKAIARQHHRQSDARGLLTGHAVAVARLACAQQSVWWWLVLSRADEPFTETEQHLATMLLRTLAARFEFPVEPGLGRVVLDSGYHPLHVDTATCVRMLHAPQLLDAVAAELPRIIEQRWPQIDDHAAHSVFITLDDRPTWVRFARGRAADADSRYWALELRPLDPDDPPAVGLVEDNRVALALGYLLDRYEQSPSLTDVARFVDSSPFHFHRLFSRQTGISPKHFLLRTQLMHAKQLLRATRRPIGDVARSTGFSSHGHFTATFNRIVGLNPSDYRDRA